MVYSPGITALSYQLYYIGQCIASKIYSKTDTENIIIRVRICMSLLKDYSSLSAFITAISFIHYIILIELLGIAEIIAEVRYA